MSRMSTRPTRALGTSPCSEAVWHSDERRGSGADDVRQKEECFKSVAEVCADDIGRRRHLRGKQNVQRSNMDTPSPTPCRANMTITKKGDVTVDVLQLKQHSAHVVSDHRLCSRGQSVAVTLESQENGGRKLNTCHGISEMLGRQEAVLTTILDSKRGMSTSEARFSGGTQEGIHVPVLTKRHIPLLQTIQKTFRDSTVAHHSEKKGRRSC